MTDYEYDAKDMSDEEIAERKEQNIERTQRTVDKAKAGQEALKRVIELEKEVSDLKALLKEKGVI
jgi:hypothetical protein